MERWEEKADLSSLVGHCDASQLLHVHAPQSLQHYVEMQTNALLAQLQNKVVVQVATDKNLFFFCYQKETKKKKKKKVKMET